MQVVALCLSTASRLTFESMPVSASLTSEDSVSLTSPLPLPLRRHHRFFCCLAGLGSAFFCFLLPAASGYSLYCSGGTGFSSRLMP